MTRLSHSAVQRYHQCGKSYALHYESKLRERTISSALLFGSAIDQALNVLLQSRDLSIAKKAFVDAWTKAEINKTLTLLPRCELVKYGQNECDLDLISDDERRVCFGLMKDLTPFLSLENALATLKKLDKKSKNEAELWAFINWTSLKAKGLLMLEAYFDEVLPRIKKVIGVQERRELRKAGSDDSILMFVDLIAEMDDGTVAVLDHKTSSMEYDPDSVKTSGQLALYTYRVKLDLGRDDIKSGYIVLSKDIKKETRRNCVQCGYDGTGGRHKTCPKEIGGKRCGGAWAETISAKAQTTVIIDTIPQHVIDLVLESFTDAAFAIGQKMFHRNLGSCVGKFGKCSFFNLCWYGNDKDLVTVK